MKRYFTFVIILQSDEAYYVLTTDEDMIEILIADKKDGSKRIVKILDMEYTIENDMLLLFDTDGIIDRMSFGSPAT